MFEAPDADPSVNLQAKQEVPWPGDRGFENEDKVPLDLDISLLSKLKDCKRRKEQRELKGILRTS